MAGLRIFAERLTGYRLIVLAAAIAGALIGAGSLADGPLEHELREVRDTIRSHPASGEIAIVEIDARSLEAIDRWPWRRSLHGRLVERLNGAEVESIAFDVDFSSRSDPAEDRAFAEALAASEALVLLPAFRQFAGSGDSRFVDSEPIDILRDNAFLASVNIRANASGVVRRAMLGVETSGLPRPSLAAMLTGTQGEADVDFPIDFAIDPATIPRVSYADVLAGNGVEDLEGKSVLVGATAIEMGDRYAVPHHGVVPGVVIQALSAETLLDGGVPVEYGPIAGIAIAFLGAIALLWPGPHWIRAAGAGAAGTVLLVLPLASEQWFNATFAISPGLMSLFGAGLAGAGVLLLRKFRRAQLQDRETGLPNRAALFAGIRGTGQVRIVAASIEGFAEIASLLSASELQSYFAEIARRLAVAGIGTIYRIDNSLVAWRADALSEEEVNDHVEGIGALFRAPIDAGAQRIDPRLFFGIAAGQSAEARNLVAGAALAAERAMAAGHRWERFVEGDGSDGKWQLSLLSELDEAMTSGALWVAFQPKFAIADRRIVSAEALVRWDHPVRGVIPPDNFIPIVEKRGRMADLTLFVAARAIGAVVRWQAAGINAGVAINVSANLLNDPGFLSRFAATVGNSGVDPKLLTVEVTESAAFENPEEAIAGMEQLRAMGIRLSVDDYGTGQSTLSYLKRLPVQEIKIDKSFVQSIEISQSDYILVRSTIELAHDLGLSVVAEGVETESCLELLRTLGCDTGQGYLIGRPMKLDQFIRAAAGPGSHGDRMAA